MFFLILLCKERVLKLNIFRILKKITFFLTPIEKKIIKGKGSIGKDNMFAFERQCIIDPGRLNYISIGDRNVFSKINIFCHDYSWTILAEVKKELIPDPGARVEIGSNNFFGFDSTIIGPVSIGNNNIIGAKSLINTDIGDNEIWAGIPAKKIGDINNLYERKKKKIETDMIYFIENFSNSHKRVPGIDEFGYLSIYFLERTKENYEKYLSQLKFKNHENLELVNKIFFSTVPIWDSYEKMLIDINH